MELVIATPVLLVLLLLVVAFGRVTHGRQLVEQASAAAARSASLAASAADAQRAGAAEAAQTLTQAGVTCQHEHAAVDVSGFHPGGQVSVTITCTASLSDLALTGLPGHQTLTATATAPLDRYRAYSLDAPR